MFDPATSAHTFRILVSDIAQVTLIPDFMRLLRERAPLYTRFRDAGLANDTTTEEAAARIWQDFCDNAD